ncbi:MAG: cytochrome c [Gemmatimonadetes bacterium]|jgi:hypothetical protein|nr:cytochrome c [Gemmatimonadota bacterium]
MRYRKLKIRQASILIAGLALIFITGCELRQAMYNQEKYEPLESSVFFNDGLSSRQPIAGTVARGNLRENTHYYQGKIDGELARELPMELTPQFLTRGQERFDIFCSPCHDRTGSGNGMIVKRGLKQPPSFHIDRLRQIEVGYFYDVMTNGFGAMYSYASRIPVEDRWAIAAYVRALQHSQSIEVSQLPAQDQQQLQSVSGQQ